MDKYAELAVRVGVNVEAGQNVIVEGYVEHAPFVRRLVEAAYKAGARHVEADYDDQHVRKSFIEHAEPDVLSWTPPYLLKKWADIVDGRVAMIFIAGDPDPNLLAGLDPDRVGSARPLELIEYRTRELGRRAFSWTIVAYPTAGWANAAFGEPDVDRLWDAVARASRLYEDDPVAAWWARVEELGARAGALDEYHFDGIRFRGPGTDLFVGLNERSRWTSADFQTNWGRRHVPNIPTEEVFTTPDYRRVEGHVSSTRPLLLPAEGVLVTDLEITFEEGRAVKVEAAAGAEVIRAQMKIDDGAAYLGEVALVDATSAVGATGVTFANTLFDENASCHIAYGAGFGFAVEGASELEPDAQAAAGVNQSRVHTDFMIGGPEVDVDGVTRDGRDVPLLRDNVWQLD
jgi:aminopeptidase